MKSFLDTLEEKVKLELGDLLANVGSARDGERKKGEALFAEVWCFSIHERKWETCGLII